MSISINFTASIIEQWGDAYNYNIIPGYRQYQFQLFGKFVINKKALTIKNRLMIEGGVGVGRCYRQRINSDYDNSIAEGDTGGTIFSIVANGKFRISKKSPSFFLFESRYTTSVSPYLNKTYIFISPVYHRVEQVKYWIRQPSFRIGWSKYF